MGTTVLNHNLHVGTLGFQQRVDNSCIFQKVVIPPSDQVDGRDANLQTQRHWNQVKLWVIKLGYINRWRAYAWGIPVDGKKISSKDCVQGLDNNFTACDHQVR